MRVVFLTACLTQYRLPFHERVRAQLIPAGIQYDVIYGQPDARDAAKGDCVDIAWGKRIVNRYFHIAGAPLVWQPAVRELCHCDLAIIGQENRLLVNYPIQSLRHFIPAKLALWGHGRNFQANNSGLALAEHWKRLWLGQCDWWFAYTEETRSILERRGYPAERITVFRNAIDTSEIVRQRDQI